MTCSILQIVVFLLYYHMYWKSIEVLPEGDDEWKAEQRKENDPHFFLLFFSSFHFFFLLIFLAFSPLLNHFCPPFLVLLLAPHHLCPIKIQNFPQFFSLHHHPGFAACNWSFPPLPLFISPSPYVSLYTPACPMSSLTFSKHYYFCSSYQLLKYLIKTTFNSHSSFG